MTTYRDIIASLINSFPIEIDTDIQLSGKSSTMAGSDFLTNKEQGDLGGADCIQCIDTRSTEDCAVRYGHSDNLAADDIGFPEFYVCDDF